MHPLQLPGVHYSIIPAQCCTVHPTRCWAPWGAETSTASSGSSPAQRWLGMGLKLCTQSGSASRDQTRDHWGCQGSLWCAGCTPYNDRTQRGAANPTSGGWFMAEGRCDQQPLQLREAGKACGDGFPVSSNTVNRNTTFQLGRDYLVRDICQKKRLQFLLKISWYLQESLLCIVTIPLRVVLWFLCLLGVTDAQALLLPLPQTSPAGSSHPLNPTRQLGATLAKYLGP